MLTTLRVNLNPDQSSLVYSVKILYVIIESAWQFC